MSNDAYNATTALIEARQREREDREKRKVLDKALSDFINGATPEEIELLAGELALDHRTLIQKKFQLFLAFSSVLAKLHEEGVYDARNEAACKIASEVMECTNGMWRLPNV